MPGGFDNQNIDFPQGDDANAGGRAQYQLDPAPKPAPAPAPAPAPKPAPAPAPAPAADDRWWWQKWGTGKGTAGDTTKLSVQKTKGGIGKKGGGRRTRARRTRGRRTRKTKPHRTKRASSNRGSDWRSHIKRTMKNNPNMKFGKDLLKLASRTFKKGVNPIYS